MRFLRNNDGEKENKKSDLEGKMDIQRTDAGNVIIISLTGRMDLNSGNQLKEEVKSVLVSGKTSIHLNLKNVEFVNSSGLGALVSIMKEVRIHRGRLTLSDMADYVREIFDITQLSHIFEIFPSEEEAMHSYQAAVPN
jgi:anti-sigma B factor antagonist